MLGTNLCIPLRADTWLSKHQGKTNDECCIIIPLVISLAGCVMTIIASVCQCFNQDLILVLSHWPPAEAITSHATHTVLHCFFLKIHNTHFLFVICPGMSVQYSLC